jgi:hypothetical protein
MPKDQELAGRFDIREWMRKHNVTLPVNDPAVRRERFLPCSVATLPGGVKFTRNDLDRIRIEACVKIRMHRSVAILRRFDDDLFNEHAD